MAETDDNDGHVKRNPNAEVRRSKEIRNPNPRLTALRGARPGSRLGLSWMVQRRKQVAAPESQQHENEGPHRTESEPAAALGEPPAHQHQAEIKQPNDHRPDDLRISPI